MSYVYIIQSEATEQFYIGYTKDLDSRIADHQAGNSRWTSSRGPWRLKYFEAFDADTAARQRELQLKRAKNKSYITWIITNGPGKRIAQ